MRYGTVKTPAVSGMGIRQSALVGAVDAFGHPSALSAGSGLAATLSASAPLRFSFAAGFDRYGQVDYVEEQTNNVTISGLPANATSYLYVERNATTGALTYGFTAGGTTYARVAPASPATGAQWFDLVNFVMNRWSGSAWVPVQRIVLGEATTNATVVTEAITYAYRGFFQSNWQAVVANTTYNFNHNLGYAPLSGNANILVYSSGSGADFQATPALPFLSVGGTDYGFQFQFPVGGATWKTIAILTKANPVLTVSNTFQATGFYRVNLTRGW